MIFLWFQDSFTINNDIILRYFNKRFLRDLHIVIYRSHKNHAFCYFNKKLTYKYIYIKFDSCGDCVLEVNLM